MKRGKYMYMPDDCSRKTLKYMTREDEENLFK